MNDLKKMLVTAIAAADPRPGFLDARREWMPIPEGGEGA